MKKNKVVNNASLEVAKSVDKTAKQNSGKNTSKYAGHRQRAKRQFLESGLEGLSQHRVLELLLFYALPQGDVYDVAKDLIDKFGGSIARVMKAPVEELIQVNRVQEHTAVLIKLIPALLAYMGMDEFETTTPIKEAEVAYQQLRPYFLGEKRECLRILCLDGNMNYLGVRTITEGKLLSVGVDMRRLVQEALLLNTVYLYLAHGHVEGPVDPSNMDWAVTAEAIKTLHSMEIFVLDHLVIGRETYASMRKIAKAEKIPLPWSE